MSAEIRRLIRNMIRIGIVTDVNAKKGCRVQIGNLETDWLNWVTLRAGSTRTMNAPSVGEQVLILALGGELTTAFVLTGIFSNEHSEPTDSITADHRTYSDGAIIEYEPATGALKATGIKTANIEASEQVSATTKVVIVNASKQINLTTPKVICSQNLTCATLNVTEGGEMTGNFTHTGGAIKSNGITLHDHTHGGVRSGGESTGKPQ
ncbi:MULTISPECIES: phage baseplate assembly protein V [Providencia]|uniref:phage baseplate assembly protein V n=1 Tax=Providencia TaxID=586 RepID=UPI0008FB9781|nr:MULTISPECIES: phage baseplate assembly protein V [Providencia]APC13986.1 Phage-related baseplate assembly protein [Providencia rettgeri]EKH6495424.1 phage baseplate assembly protein V [Providencia rettgeri]ELR5052693.1 phage baseplate assembly protein V [Providencia rettgeri]ELR5154042.1 phage baseplate assembly protein V [Providencia rettgeri]ELR5180609.1 phage baseplate assembly protein V [Providencia rettgeri]